MLFVLCSVVCFRKLKQRRQIQIFEFISKFQFDLEQWTNSHSVDVPLKFPFIYFIIIFYLFICLWYDCFVLFILCSVVCIDWCGVVCIVLHSMGLRPLVGISLHRIALPCFVDIFVHTFNLCSFPVLFSFRQRTTSSLVLFTIWCYPNCLISHCAVLYRIALQTMEALTVLQNNIFKKSRIYLADEKQYILHQVCRKKQAVCGA